MSRESYYKRNLLSLLILLIHGSIAATAQDLTISSFCQSHCGRIPIPYPFGIGKDCYLNNDKWYEVICNNSSGNPVPFLSNINKEVVNISLPNGFRTSFGLIQIKNPVTSLGCSNGEELSFALNVTGSPFFLTASNTLVAVGCNNKALMTDIEPQIGGCESTCNVGPSRREQNISCDGYRCCQAKIPSDHLQQIGIRIESLDGNDTTTSGGCRVAFLTDETYSPSNITESEMFYTKGYATVELGWFIDLSHNVSIDSGVCVTIGTEGGSYNNFDACICEYGKYLARSYRSCRCNSGYRGNPYLSSGCIDIDECKEAKAEGRNRCRKGHDCGNIAGNYECRKRKSQTLAIILGTSLGFGLLVLAIGAWWLYKFIKKQREIKRKKKFFKRNGGLLLQQQLTPNEGNLEKTKVFSSKELEKATENFSVNRVLGQGGQGTVYKGMLVDGRIVAVKKSKVVDEDKLEEFINEVVILSQINHRNIVKLLGCCLETEVPVLVYEFIPNGNLFQHLHHNDECDDDYAISTWEMRLRIAVDIAGALSYLHSAASFPIYHRDIKTTNIMLDEKYRAKVSDFGTSRSVTIDHTHLTTVVAGTVGYVDPEYFQSSQFTDKSDVYSFGIVLVELITGEKPVSFLRSDENRTLATYFILAMKESKFSEIIDARIKDNCNLEQVTAVANLARRCLNLNGKKRPNMREVSVELERIRDSQVQIHNEEDDDSDTVEINVGDSWSVLITDSYSNFTTTSSSRRTL